MDRDNLLWPPQEYFEEYDKKIINYAGSSSADALSDRSRSPRKRVRRGSEGYEVKMLTPADRERMVQEYDDTSSEDDVPLETLRMRRLS